MNDINSQIINAFTYAGFWRRFIAYILDQIILFPFAAAISFILGLIGLGDQVITASLTMLLTFIYNVVFNCSSLCATPGKAILGIAIVDEKTQSQITFKQSIIRFLSSFLSGLVLFLGYLIQPFTAKRQTLHDMITETTVIRKNQPDVNYITVFKENFSKILNQ